MTIGCPRCGGNCTIEVMGGLTSAGAGAGFVGGAFLGGRVGSVFGPLGTIGGALLGGMLGAAGGSIPGGVIDEFAPPKTTCPNCGYTGQVVFVGERGRRYHRSECDRLPLSYEAVWKARAERRGQEPCRHCSP